MDSFAEADKDYLKAIEAIGTELPKAFKSARTVSKVDLTSDDLTKAILLRLNSFYKTQDIIKELLDKHKAAAAADFFVETVVFFLSVAFEKIDPSIRVASEQTVDKTKKAKRPDISLWRNDKLVAVIECKTQLGYNRSGWQSDFEQREHSFRKTHANARLFLLVLTGSNWPGFSVGDERIGRQFFVILDKKTTPREFKLVGTQNTIVHRIEQLIEQIVVSLSSA